MRAYGSDELGGDCLLNLIRVRGLLTNKNLLSYFDLGEACQTRGRLEVDV